MVRIKRDSQDEYDDYIVTPHAQQRGVKLYYMRKQGAETSYLVGYDRQQGGQVCNCPDNTKNKPNGGCKHIKALKAFWIIF